MPRVTSEETEVQRHGGMGLRKTQKTYEPGTKLGTLKYIKFNHSHNKLGVVPAIRWLPQNGNTISILLRDLVKNRFYHQLAVRKLRLREVNCLSSHRLHVRAPEFGLDFVLPHHVLSLA